MKARILDPMVKVYSSMEENAISIATLPQGSEVDYGGAKKRAGKLWVPVTLSTGQQAFIPGETRIYQIREGALMQDNVKVFAEATGESQIRKQLPRNSKISILETVKGAGQVWVRIRDANGGEGFISGETRLRVTQQKSKAMGRKNIMSGAMWLIAGLVIAFSGISRTSGGSFSLLGYGAILFGAVMLISGLVQFITAPA